MKWEYCVLLGIHLSGSTLPQGALATSYPKLYRLTNKGAELVTEFKDRARSMSEQDAVAQRIAQMGLEGWEIAGVDASGGLHFKRQLP